MRCVGIVRSWIGGDGIFPASEQFTISRPILGAVHSTALEQSEEVPQRYLGRVRVVDPGDETGRKVRLPQQRQSSLLRALQRLAVRQQPRVAEPHQPQGAIAQMAVRLVQPVDDVFLNDETLQQVVDMAGDGGAELG